MTWLDDLPDDLLIHILSLLPSISAVQTSVISRRYRHLWTTISSLTFSHRESCDAVDQTILLHQQNRPIHTFLLERDFNQDHLYPFIRSCIINAVNLGAVNLTVRFFDPFDHDFNGQENPIFLFPFSALRISVVRVLRISRCCLEFHRNLELHSVREIYMDWILMDVSVPREMLRGCVNLERLGLRRGWGLGSLSFSGAKIKWLSFRDFDCASLEIDCPNLEFLEIQMVRMAKFELKDATSLVEANVSFAYHSVNVEYWGKVMSLLGRVHKLKVQTWWYKECTSVEFFKQINLSLPKLRLAKIRRFTGQQAEHLFLQFLKSQANACQKIVVVHIENGNEKYTYNVWVRSEASAVGSTPQWVLLPSY